MFRKVSLHIDIRHRAARYSSEPQDPSGPLVVIPGRSNDLGQPLVERRTKSRSVRKRRRRDHSAGFPSTPQREFQVPRPPSPRMLGFLFQSTCRFNSKPYRWTSKKNLRRRSRFSLTHVPKPQGSCSWDSPSVSLGLVPHSHSVLNIKIPSLYGPSWLDLSGLAVLEEVRINTRPDDLGSRLIRPFL